jgi:hypothetical protein
MNIISRDSWHPEFEMLHETYDGVKFLTILRQPTSFLDGNGSVVLSRLADCDGRRLAFVLPPLCPGESVDSAIVMALTDGRAGLTLVDVAVAIVLGPPRSWVINDPVQRETTRKPAVVTKQAE